MADAMHMEGAYVVRYSEHSAQKTGRGYFADLLWLHRPSPAFTFASGADKWAQHNGGARRIET